MNYTVIYIIRSCYAQSLSFIKSDKPSFQNNKHDCNIHEHMIHDPRSVTKNREAEEKICFFFSTKPKLSKSMLGQVTILVSRLMSLENPKKKIVKNVHITIKGT